MIAFPRIAHVETFIVSLPRDTPYLGPLGPGERINERGYLIRQGNRTIYPSTDMSVLIKVTADDGTVGWGETYGIVAPDAVTSIIDDVLGPVIVGRDPRDVVVIQEDLYDLMRVRGFFGGFYVDAIAGIDIAVWDLFGKLVSQPVVKLIGGQRHDTIPAYVSGLPGATLDARLELARSFVALGFDAIKYHSAVSLEGIVAEMRALREGLSPKVKLMVDLHWKFTAQEAVQLIDQLVPYSPYFVEAPASRRILRARRMSARTCACRSRSARNGVRFLSFARASNAARCRSCSQRWATPVSASSCRSAAWPMPFT